MPVIQNATGQIPRFSKEIFEKLARIISEESRTLAETEVKKRIKAVNAIASKQFYNSVASEVKKSGSRSFIVRVGSDDRAAEPIETGIKPTRVPIAAILKWMRDKGIGSDPAFARYVQNKLAEEGYEGRHIFEKAEESLVSKLDNLVEDILNREELFES